MFPSKEFFNFFLLLLFFFIFFWGGGGGRWEASYIETFKDERALVQSYTLTPIEPFVDNLNKARPQLNIINNYL